MGDASVLIAGHETLIRSARTPEDLEHAIAVTVACLEDLERRCERERSTIENALHPQVWKDWKLAQLDRWRQDSRAPLIQHMAMLHQRLVSMQIVRERSRDVLRSDAPGTAAGPHEALN